MLTIKFTDRFSRRLLLACAMSIAAIVSSQVLAEQPAKEAWDGYVVRNINIAVKDVFEKDELNSIYRTANSLKINTKQSVVKQELVFKEGDELTPFLVKESLRNLRSIKFIRLPELKVEIVGKNLVDIYISVQDTWTFIPQFSYSSSGGQRSQSIGVQDSNVLGYGERFELLSTQEDQKSATEMVWNDRRVMGTPYQFVTGIFDRDDGDRYVTTFDRPFRTLLDRHSMEIKLDTSDQLGELFEDSDEDFVYRRKSVLIGGKYTYAVGNPEKLTRRYSWGFDFNQDIFKEATQEDIDILDLDDPSMLNQDPSRLADDRRFYGPTFEYEYIKPDFVPLNYIDRFDRPEDYNLGRQVIGRLQYSSEVFGAEGNTFLMAANTRKGYRISDQSFWRYDLSGVSRYDPDGFTNSLFTAAARYYNILGQVKIRGLNFGRHTLVAASQLEYGEDLDQDRQLLVGADNALRGYKARTFTGDKRFVLNLEDRLHLAEDVYRIVSFGAAFFVDVGAASYDPLGDMFADQMYGNVGTGLRMAFPRSSGSRVLRLDVSLPFREGPDGSGAWEPRFVISGGQLFDSFFPGERPGSDNTTVDFGF